MGNGQHLISRPSMCCVGCHHNNQVYKSWPYRVSATLPVRKRLFSEHIVKKENLIAQPNWFVNHVVIFIIYVPKLIISTFYPKGWVPCTERGSESQFLYEFSENFRRDSDHPWAKKYKKDLSDLRATWVSWMKHKWYLIYWLSTEFFWLWLALYWLSTDFYWSELTYLTL